MKLIFIHGPAAAGKLTVGRALAERTGFKLFHNHLVVDALLAVFPFGSEPFVRLREEMWMAVFEAACRDGISLIFTFAPEATVKGDFPNRAVAAVTGLGGQVHFVELRCPIAELERRIENPSRREFQKLRSIERFRELRKAGGDRFPPLPSGLVIDTLVSSPAASATTICDKLGLGK